MKKHIFDYIQAGLMVLLLIMLWYFYTQEKKWNEELILALKQKQ